MPDTNACLTAERLDEIHWAATQGHIIATPEEVAELCFGYVPPASDDDDDAV